MNVNIALPHGGSGGAAINSKGELVGVCTQTKGELTNIRAITEAIPLIEKAKSVVDKEKKEREKRMNELRDPLQDDCAFDVCTIGSNSKRHLGQFVRRIKSVG